MPPSGHSYRRTRYCGFSSVLGVYLKLKVNAVCGTTRRCQSMLTSLLLMVAYRACPAMFCEDVLPSVFTNIWRYLQTAAVSDVSGCLLSPLCPECWRRLPKRLLMRKVCWWASGCLSPSAAIEWPLNSKSYAVPSRGGRCYRVPQGPDTESVRTTFVQPNGGSGGRGGYSQRL